MTPLLLPGFYILYARRRGAAVPWLRLMTMTLFGFFLIAPSISSFANCIPSIHPFYSLS